MNLSADSSRAVAVLVGSVAILAALWTLAINPKRQDSSAARGRADTQQQHLDEARGLIGTYTRDKARFAENKAELARLDTAVPVRGDIAVLLRSLQGEARRRGAELRIAALKEGAAAAGPAGQTLPSPSPGAQPGPAGLSQLPFNLQYTGKYHDLLHVLRTVRRAVTERDGKVTARNRLLTIDGLAFSRPDAGRSGIVNATINATAYIAPDPSAPAPAAASGTP